MQPITGFAGLHIFIHGTKHLPTSGLACEANLGRDLVVKHEPNEWDANAFNIYMMFRNRAMVKIGCVQRNLAQLLARLGEPVLAGRLSTGTNSYGRDVFEVELFGPIRDQDRYTANIYEPSPIPKKGKGFFDRKTVGLKPGDPDSDSEDL